MAEPIKLTRIRVERLGGLEQVYLDELPPGEDEGGQWLLFMGENGVGKTTLLHSIALCCVPFEHATSIIDSSQKQWVHTLFMDEQNASVLVERGTESGNIQLFSTSSTQSRLISGAHSSGIHSFLLLAYGCQRGSALGGPKREVDFSPLEAVSTLFNLSDGLIHAETWLRDLAFAALKNSGGPDEAFFEAVKQTLLELLPGVTSIEVEPDGTWLEGPLLGRAPLAAFSDGYLTTAGWVLDMIARWSHRQKRAGTPPDGAFSAEMTGLILVDEIDLHLHPRWQLHIIDDLRTHFPKLSFVATTHNPLTALGARPGELHIMQRDPQTADISVIQQDIPPGTRADQVLTGVWFGLPSTLDRSTRDLLEQHRQLLRSGAPQDAPERIRLEQTLRSRLGSFADTSVDRLALSVAAEVMEAPPEQMTATQREQAREQVLSRLRRLKASSE